MLHMPMSQDGSLLNPTDPGQRDRTTGADLLHSIGRLDTDQVRQILPQLIDALSDAVLVVDSERRVVAANRRYLETFGPLRAEIIGATCHEALACPEGSTGGRGLCAACEAMALREPRRMMRNLPDATGVLRRWETTLNPLIDGDGRVTHVVEVWRDVTDRTQLEGQLSHSERLASLGLLAAGVAHEVNNPLASIVAGVESIRRWLNRSPDMPADQAAELSDVLDVLERETQRSRETTDKLLLLAQPYRAAPRWVDLNRAVRDTLTLLGYQMRQQDVKVVEDLDPETPPLWAREGGIRGICMNLCLNAVQAIPAGGTITVRTRGRRDGATLIVEDDGPGIRPEHMERIWDPFFTTKPVGKGTGLGLSITQRIITRHGGTIRVESVYGKGARFVVELPAQGPGGQDV